MVTFVRRRALIIGSNRTRVGTAGALALLNELQFFGFFFCFFFWSPGNQLPYPSLLPPLSLSHFLSLFLSPAVSISLPPIDPFIRHFFARYPLCSVAPFTGVTADVREHSSGGFIVPGGWQRVTVDTHPIEKVNKQIK